MSEEKRDTVARFSKGGLRDGSNPTNQEKSVKPGPYVRTDLTPMPEIGEGLTPEVVAKIKAEMASKKVRTVAGRPWWVSVYTVDELKKAGLV